MDIKVNKYIRDENGRLLTFNKDYVFKMKSSLTKNSQASNNII